MAEKAHLRKGRRSTVHTAPSGQLWPRQRPPVTTASGCVGCPHCPQHLCSIVPGRAHLLQFSPHPSGLVSTTPVVCPPHLALGGWNARGWVVLGSLLSPGWLIHTHNSSKVTSSRKSSLTTPPTYIQKHGQMHSLSRLVSVARTSQNMAQVISRVSTWCWRAGTGSVPLCTRPHARPKQAPDKCV